MDCIEIKELEVYCHHGVLKEENVLGQKFSVSIILYTDTKMAGVSDDLEQSVDYAKVSYFVKERMEEKNFKLIEAAAEYVAENVLLSFPLVQRIRVEIKKPWAPILLPLETVSVAIERGWAKVYLSIGSNMGNREEYLQTALEKLRQERTIRGVRVSDWIETEPYGYVEQASFLNAAVELETLESPDSLLKILQKIETEGGRERTIHWGPRTIDLDIVLFGDVVMQTEMLTIPHREMHLREFVLRPLAQLAPWVSHPVYHKTVSELWEQLRRKNTGGGNETDD